MPPCQDKVRRAEGEEGRKERRREDR